MTQPDPTRPDRWMDQTDVQLSFDCKVSRRLTRLPRSGIVFGRLCVYDFFNIVTVCKHVYLLAALRENS